MLNDIREVMEITGVPIGDGGQIRSNIQWSHHLSFSIIFGRERYYLKVAPEEEDAPLRNEARALSAVHPTLRYNTPEFVGLINHRGFSFLVMSFLESKPLTDLSTILRHETRVRQWEEFFNALHSLGQKTEFRVDTELMTFDRSIPGLAKYIYRLGVSELVQKVVCFSQHGDLATPNLGERSSRPIVYDWEDYGRVTVRGFDLALFMGSLLNHDADRMLQLLQSNTKPQRMVRRLIEVNRLSLQEFRLLLPVYYGLFFNLKQANGYGGKITALAHNVAMKYLSRLNGEDESERHVIKSRVLHTLGRGL